LVPIQPLFAAAALGVAAAALVKVRRTAKRLERLTESYWELRYEYGQLRARLARLEPPDVTEGVRLKPEATERAPGSATQSFVPLSSLKMPR
jgi:type II secretory pathway component PulJ